MVTFYPLRGEFEGGERVPSTGGRVEGWGCRRERWGRLGDGRNEGKGSEYSHFSYTQKKIF